MTRTASNFPELLPVIQMSVLSFSEQIESGERDLLTLPTSGNNPDAEGDSFRMTRLLLTTLDSIAGRQDEAVSRRIKERLDKLPSPSVKQDVATKPGANPTDRDKWLNELMENNDPDTVVSKVEEVENIEDRLGFLLYYARTIKKEHPEVASAILDKADNLLLDFGKNAAPRDELNLRTSYKRISNALDIFSISAEVAPQQRTV
jgi:hypothetical protein